MNLYLLRHAIAAASGVAGDASRPLTEEGIEKMRLAAKGMRILELEFNVVLSSPYLRAKQTAEIVVEEFEIQSRLKFDDCLASGASIKNMISVLDKKYRDVENLLLVGHEPCLSALASMLLIGNTELPLVMKKGGLCKLTVSRLMQGPCAQLEWHMAPFQLRALGEV